MTTAAHVLLAATLLVACSRPSAMSVCQRLEAGDVARGCRFDVTEGIFAAATERVRFDLKDSPGMTGQIAKFESEEHLMRTARTLADLEPLTGKNRFISPRARILVHLGAKAESSDIDFTRDLVNDL